ncbi:MAG: transglycosylase domain-containing protein [Bacteroidia bacterium]
MILYPLRWLLRQVWGWIFSVLLLIVGVIWVLRWVPMPPAGVLAGFFSGQVPQWGWLGEGPVRERLVQVIKRMETESAVRRRHRPPLSQRVAEQLFYPPSIPKWGSRPLGLLIQALWGEERVLIFYLNSVRYEANLYGLKAAAQAYFHKEIEALTPAEVADLLLLTTGIPREKLIAEPFIRERKKLETLFASEINNVTKVHQTR